MIDFTIIGVMKKKYDIIEHTADVGIKAYGRDISECFAHAAVGMFDLITERSCIEEKGAYKIDLSAEDLEQLLVDFLSELLFLHGSRNLIFGAITVDVDGEKCALSAIVHGEKLDLSKHKYGMEIKAVTYHMLEIHDCEPFYVNVLFDI